MTSMIDTATEVALCPGCGEGGATAELHGHDRLIGAPGAFSVLRCPGCGLAYTSPRIGPEDFDRYYPSEEYSSYHTKDRGLLRRWLNRARLGALVRRAPYRAIDATSPGRLLDVGCGCGDLGEAFSREGWSASGVEPSPGAAAQAESRGLDVHVGTLDDAPWPEQHFDAILFNHSLEHLPDPAGALEQARALLRPGGVLVIAVPNMGSWQRRAFGSHWFQLDLPRHLQHFDRGSLPLLLSRVGFDVTEVSSASMRPGLLSSLQYRVFGRRRFAGRGFRLAAWATAPLLLLLDRFTEGDCLHVVARR